MKLRSGKNPDNQRKNLEKDLKLPPLPKKLNHPKKINQPDQNKQNEFDKLYKDLKQPGAFTNKIKIYLRRNQTHSLHRPKRKKFLRRKLVTHFPGHIVQSDLIDMQKFSTSNSGYSFILVVIDCFSKYLWCLPMKSKSGKETAKSLRIIFSKMKYPVQTMIFDQGLEYLNQHVKNLLSERGIHWYHIFGQHKSSTAKRVNKTIKQVIWKIFTEARTKKWVNNLDQIVDNYNSTFHTTIKMSPNEVTFENRKKVFKRMFPQYRDRINCKLEVNNKVRVAKNKDIFEKGFTENWSREIFTIVKVFQRNRVCWYRLRDHNGQIYSKGKYFYQLQKI